MNWPRSVAPLGLAFALLAAGCATAPPAPEAPIAPVAPSAPGAATSQPAPGSVLRESVRDPALEARILALDPEHITDAQVRETLALGPTPRIVLLHGGIYPVHLLMESFGRFLTRMGYPEDRIRDPRDRAWSRTPYEDGSLVAGLVAWYYEHDGVRPMMVGHSQGGIQAVKVLRELNGAFGDRLQVFNPLTAAAENRTTFLDPLTGEERPVVGFKVPYVSVVAAGGAALLLPNQWTMIGHMELIPDTVEDFTGFTVQLDPVAWAGTAAFEYRHNGTAHVRNVALPASYSHVFVPLADDLARDSRTRNWINDYTPPDGNPPEPPADLGQNVLFAADVWYSIKKHWALEAQRLIRARKAALGTR